MIHYDTQLLALICGHFCGDFILQSERLVILKQTRPLWMCAHAATVALVTWLLLGNLGAWWLMAIIAAMHLLIDTCKIRLGSPQSPPTPLSLDCSNEEGKIHSSSSSCEHALFWFFLDQALHLAVLIVLWFGLQGDAGALFAHNAWNILWGTAYNQALILATGLALGVFAVGVILKLQMDEFALSLTRLSPQGLPKGGKTIGILERLLVFLFVLAEKPEGIGFIVAAKSVFRIGDLTNRAERDQAEYIMIGTLRSFSYALVFAFTTQWLLRHMGV